jgi:hypothetical protein
MMDDPRDSFDFKLFWKKDRSWYLGREQAGVDQAAAFPPTWDVRRFDCHICGARYKRYKHSHHAFVCVGCEQEIHDEYPNEKSGQP